MKGHLSSKLETMDVRALMEESLDVLRTYRHDLMNHVQLIRAYTQLKKFDRLQEPIGTLVEEARRHTEWSSLPSAMISYVVLSRDIQYPMLNLHVSYEQLETPPEAAETEAALLLAALLDAVGTQSRTRLEPLAFDLWIVSLAEGFEIRWFIGDLDAPTLTIDWAHWTAEHTAPGTLFAQERVEDGVEHVIRLLVQD